MKRKILTTAITTVALAATSHGAIVWTGAVSGDMTNDANWDFSGSALATITGIENATLADDIEIGTAGTTPLFGSNNGSQNRWGVAAGNTVTVDGVNLALTAGANDGWGAGNATISVTNGGSLQAFFTIADIIVDGTSSIQLDGGGDPINFGLGGSVNLLTGGQLTLASAAEITEQIGDGGLLVNGVTVTAGNRATLLNEAGATVTAVPEPSSAALLGLGGLTALLRRRRKS